MGYKLKTHSGASKDLKRLEAQLNQGVLIEIISLLNSLQKGKDITEDLISSEELF